MRGPLGTPQASINGHELLLGLAPVHLHDAGGPRLDAPSGQGALHR